MSWSARLLFVAYGMGVGVGTVVAAGRLFSLLGHLPGMLTLSLLVLVALFTVGVVAAGPAVTMLFLGAALAMGAVTVVSAVREDLLEGLAGVLDLAHLGVFVILALVLLAPLLLGSGSGRGAGQSG